MDAWGSYCGKSECYTGLQRRHRLYRHVDPDLGEIKASFDGRALTYGFGKLDALVPAYAATIHKS